MNQGINFLNQKQTKLEKIPTKKKSFCAKKGRDRMPDKHTY